MPRAHGCYDSQMSRGCRALLAIAALALGACDAREVADAGAPDAAEDAAEDAGCAFCDAGPVQPGPPDALPPPQVACDDAGACPLPPSICADPQYLEYFDNGTCVDGGCEYDVALTSCPYGCVDGGCYGPQLTKAPPP